MKVIFVAFITVLITACKWEYPCGDLSPVTVVVSNCSASNIESESESVVIASQAKLNGIQLNGLMTLGSTAQVVISCENCPGTIYYRWLIDNAVVSTTDSHEFTASDLGKTVRIEVQLTDSQQVVSEPEYATFQSIVVEEIISNDFAFAARKTDGSVITWGISANGGDSSSVTAELVDVTTIVPGNGTFAAIKRDGSVVTWGVASYGGDSSAVTGQLNDVTSIAASNFAFAALKGDGTVVAWGDPLRGGDLEGLTPSNITSVVGNNTSFVAIDNLGATYFWGLDSSGGVPVSVMPNYGVSDVQSAIGNDLAFALLKTDGSVTGHGNNSYGGDMATLAARITNADSLYSSWFGFAALIDDGSIVSWGNIDGVSYGVSGNTAFLEPTVTNATMITASRDAFAAVEAAGTVVAWGDANDGGDNSAVVADLVNVDFVVAARAAFAAKKSDGSVVAWGDATRGGDTSLNLSGSLSNVETIVSSLYSFAAITDDKQIVTWGLLSHADISLVTADLAPSVIQLDNSYDP
ncbi:hypothetical protein [Vibrio ouci]|uniref:Lipoprotein n=1 Tax=Vibrio ouci TaxID=2499078 RepID=A0A4Y8W9P3_9VIBR|nr:hypothetical protein [Vibrio ouci]TFH89547.1 hypothetical protein ELS82_21675 [Vibrio ouci]